MAKMTELTVKVDRDIKEQCSRLNDCPMIPVSHALAMLRKRYGR